MWPGLWWRDVSVGGPIRIAFPGIGGDLLSVACFNV